VQRIGALRAGARLLDSAFLIPKLHIRFGLDPILGLLPGLGDLVSPIFTIGIILQARELGVPRVVLGRMVLNVAVDALVGVVPLVGDLFDVAWRANVRNMDLLDQHAHDERSPSAGDWLVVGLAVLLLAGLAVLPALLLAWLVSWLR
jgi:hypothetical protein